MNTRKCFTKNIYNTICFLWLRYSLKLIFNLHFTVNALLPSQLAKTLATHPLIKHTKSKRIHRMLPTNTSVPLS